MKDVAKLEQSINSLVNEVNCLSENTKKLFDKVINENMDIGKILYDLTKSTELIKKVNERIC